MKLEWKEIIPSEDADEEAHNHHAVVVVVEEVEEVEVEVEEVVITKTTIRGIILIAEIMIADLLFLLLPLPLPLLAPLAVVLVLHWIHAVHLIRHRLHIMIQYGHIH